MPHAIIIEQKNKQQRESKLVVAMDLAWENLSDPELDSISFKSGEQNNEPRGTKSSAYFNLLSSMVGGGCLSLPLSYALSGNLLCGPFLTIFIAVTSYFSMMCLIDSSRLAFGAGAAVSSIGDRKPSYESIAHAAYGSRLKNCTMILVILLCIFSTIAYAVLLRDMLEPFAHYMFPPKTSDDNNNMLTSVFSVLTNNSNTTGTGTSDNSNNIQHHVSHIENAFMWIVIILASPLCTLRNLTALRHVGAASMISILVLTLCVVYRSYQCNFTTSEYHSNRLGSVRDFLRFYPQSFSDLLTALPLFVTTYICHFNAIPVFNDFQNPTPKRVKYVAQATMATALVLYLVFGFSGSIYANCTATGQVEGNILLDFNEDDVLLLIGRTCLALTITFAFPILVVPARDTFLRICGEQGFHFNFSKLDLWLKSSRRKYRESQQKKKRKIKEKNDLNTIIREFDLDTSTDFCDPLLDSGDGTGQQQQPQQQAFSSDVTNDNQYEEQRHQQQDASSLDTIDLVSDFKARSIVGISFFWSAASVASMIQSVDVVWGILGSSVSIMVGFLIPLACYIKICKQGAGISAAESFGGGSTRVRQSKYQSDFGNGKERYIASVVLFWFYLVVAVTLTVHAVHRTFFSAH